VTGAHRLAGNGAELIRERALAARVQEALERVYQLDRVADVGDFLHGAGEGEREALLMREADDGVLEVTLRLPQLRRRSPDPALQAVPSGGVAEALSTPGRPFPGSGNGPTHDNNGDADLDALCQIIEGVSHFVYIVERARMQRGTTQLELELQAEVDKWLVLAASMRRLDVDGSAALRTRLYEHVVFEHDGATELGERYRVANDTANRFVRRLERDYVAPARFDELRVELRRFFQVGQEEKLRLGRAA
jgi:hypothetical protein